MLTITQCAEDRLAAEVSAVLLDRVVRERARADWLQAYWSPETIDTHRCVVDLEGRCGHSDRAGIRAVQGRSPLRLHPRDRSTGRSLTGNAALAYVCVRLASVQAARGGEVPRALLLAFDTDGKGEAERCVAGVTAACADVVPGIAVLVAEAHQEFDAWVLAGFSPSNTHERAAHREATSQLGFDPLAEPHRLTSNVAGDARDAKALCARLLGLETQAHLGHERVKACVHDASLDLLERRGRQAGIAEYLAAVATVVLPLLGE